MSTAKIAITLDRELVEEIDRWVRERKYPNRSEAIQDAMKERVVRWRRTRLAEESTRLDPREEKALAEESLSAENDAWPEY